jgi:hypothetical protein
MSGHIATYRPQFAAPSSLHLRHHRRVHRQPRRVVRFLYLLVRVFVLCARLLSYTGSDLSASCGGRRLRGTLLDAFAGGWVFDASPTRAAGGPRILSVLRKKIKQSPI